MCYSDWLRSGGTFGEGLTYFISKANENESIEAQPGKVIKEEIEDSPISIFSFFVRDWKEQWDISRQPDYEESDEPT